MILFSLKTVILSTFYKTRSEHKNVIVSGCWHGCKMWPLTLKGELIYKSLKTMSPGKYLDLSGVNKVNNLKYYTV